jgi:hypothetical protein
LPVFTEVRVLNPWSGRRSVAATLATLIPAIAAGQEGASVLRGIIRDSTGQPIAYAQVSAGRALERLSDDSGRFQVVIRDPGPHPVTIRRVGFRPVELTFDRTPDTTLTQIVMRPLAATLETVRIETERILRALELSGFYERMEDRGRVSARATSSRPRRSSGVAFSESRSISSAFRASSCVESAPPAASLRPSAATGVR